MEDQGVMVFFYFNKMGDFLLLKDKGKYSHLKYDKDYILNILILLSKWKDKKRL
ncbi:Uncharacterised protein [[Pasteurella] mairii]|uniref:Uncharacterized protein n=1 Tax=[Pasteurella] mairii TaxID=757 RepID=A0A379B7P7_9PAST|nr:Uncharacterised protein [[Pasteurella] mairii]